MTSTCEFPGSPDAALADDAAGCAALDDASLDGAALAGDALSGASALDAEPYQALFLHASEAMFYTAPDGTILAANPAACRLFGYPQQELEGASSDLVRDLDDPRRPAAMAELQRTGRFTGMLRYRRSDGSVFVGEVTSTSFRTGDGAERWCAIVRDVTRRAEEEAAARDEVRHATSAHERQRISDVMHDVAMQQLFCASLELDRAAVAAYRLARSGAERPLPAAGPADRAADEPRGRLWQQVHDEIEAAGEYLRTAIRELRSSLEIASAADTAGRGRLPDEPWRPRSA